MQQKKQTLKFSRFLATNTIKFRMFLVFAITVAVLLLVTISSVIVMHIVQVTMDRFIKQDFPTVEQTRRLNYLVKKIASDAQKLPLSQTKSSLNENYDRIDELLIQLENTGNHLSKNGEIDEDILQMLLLAQQIRSQTQLGFQLLASSLDLELERRSLKTDALNSITNLTDRVLQELAIDRTKTQRLRFQQSLTILRSIKTIEIILVNPEPMNTLEQNTLERTQVLTEIAMLEKSLSNPPGTPKNNQTSAIEQVGSIPWGEFFDLREHQLSLLDTNEAILSDLQATVNQLVKFSDDYTKQTIAQFARNKTRVFQVEKFAILSIIFVSAIAIATITLVQWHIVERGFSQRLDSIGQSLARVPKTSEETHIPVSGNDEIALMARRVEALLVKTLKIQIMATTDELTQVANRRYFFEQVEREIKRAMRSGQEATVLMLDIDFFKKINDTYGHDIGDLVLKRIAQTCKNSLRISDILARLGGEEFAIFCPETPVEGGNILAERIRSNIDRLQIDLGNKTKIKVSISVGVAKVDPLSTNINQALKSADRALYTAKEQGRNRVVVADRDRLNSI